MKTINLCVVLFLSGLQGASAQASFSVVVPRGSWPYSTYQSLVKMGAAPAVIKHSESAGAPTLTRYEFAVAIDRAQTDFKVRNLNHQRNSTIRRLLSRLVKEFGPEIRKLDSVKPRKKVALLSFG